MASGIALDDDGKRTADHVLGLHGVCKGYRNRPGRRSGRAQADVGEGDSHAAAALVNCLATVDVDLAKLRCHNRSPD